MSTSMPAATPTPSPNELVPLDKLPELIRTRMPVAKELQHLTTLPEAQAVTFEWQKRTFAVKTSLMVFEVKGSGARQQLFVTGASMLIQAVCRTTVGNRRVVEEIIQTLQGAEELARTQKDLALQKIAAVKATLARLAGTPRQAKPA